MPVLIQALKPYRITAISAGWGHSVVLSTDGRAFTFGKNDCGQLGLGPDAGKVDTPRVVRELTSVRLIAAACGAFHTAFLTELGQVYLTGEVLSDKADLPTLVPLPLWCVDLVCAPFHTTAICQGRTMREVCVWGKNSSGELGLGGLSDQCHSSHSHYNHSSPTSHSPSLAPSTLSFTL